MVGEELETRRELPLGLLPGGRVDVVSQTIGRTGQKRKPDHGGGPTEQLIQNGIRRTFRLRLQGAGHAQDGGLEIAVDRLAAGLTDLFERPCPVESEGPGRAEELRSVGDGQDRFHPDPEATDLPTALLRHTHPKDGLGSFRRDLLSFVRAVQVRVGEDDVYLPAGRMRDLVRGILDEFEQLAIPVTALGDPTLTIGVFQNQPRVDAICLQNARRLFDDRLDDGRLARTIRHIGVVQSIPIPWL
ncbi:hypothetical protein [Streptomyces sp. CS090A]|uniref:hypothetical protein n=1 Tax=Streptomyces sp. CS090A TaxID=2162710 RepID=UPI001EF61BD6|nr:hypothetical protein [Streptomyces sp. CS090A]